MGEIKSRSGLDGSSFYSGNTNFKVKIYKELDYFGMRKKVQKLFKQGKW